MERDAFDSWDGEGKLPSDPTLAVSELVMASAGTPSTDAWRALASVPLPLVPAAAPGRWGPAPLWEGPDCCPGPKYARLSSVDMRMACNVDRLEEGCLQTHDDSTVLEQVPSSLRPHERTGPRGGESSEGPRKDDKARGE